MYTTVQKFGISKKLILLFSKDALSWSKVTIKTFIMVQNIYILKSYFEISSENPEKNNHSFYKMNNCYQHWR